MKKVLNIILSIMLAITIFLSVICITIFNRNYIKFELRIHSYYDTILNNIINESNDSIEVDNNQIRKDVDTYIDNYYKDCKCSNDNTIYKDNIMFFNKYKNMRLYHDILCLATLGIIIITGILFLKTKKVHNIKCIIYITSILGIIISFIIYLNISYTGIINLIIKDYYYIYLGINVLLLLIQPFIILYNKIVKKNHYNSYIIF
jgi:hypothetical protein